MVIIILKLLADNSFQLGTDQTRCNIVTFIQSIGGAR